MMRANQIEEIAKKYEPSIFGHYACEDPWYSCPKSEDGCANEADGDNCTCGYDGKVAAFQSALRELLTLCMAEVDAEQQFWRKGSKEYANFGLVKARLARLGESGERAATK